MSNVKDFNTWLNESKGSDNITIDLQKDFPEINDTRNEDEDEMYTDKITTTLEIQDAKEMKPGKEDYIDPSFKTSPIKIKMIYTDTEEGYGTYGPHGGSYIVNIFAGVDSMDKKTILDLFKKMWNTEDYFSM